jgi:hypothetical protein
LKQNKIYMATETLIQKGQPGYNNVEQAKLRKASAAPTLAPATVQDTQVATTIGGSSYNAGGGKINPYNQPITSASMTPAPAVALPTPTTPTTTAPVEAAVNASTANVTKANDAAATAATTAPTTTQADNLAKTMKDVLGIQDQIATETASVDRAAQDKARVEADQYTSQIEQEALAARRATESLQKNNPQGLFGGALQDEVNRLNRDSLSKQADLAILQNAALRKFDTAKSIADRQLELKLEPLKTKLDNLKFFYGENKDILSKADDRAYNELIKTKDREYNKIAAAETELLNVKKELFKNGAPVSIIQAAQSAGTVEELLTTPGISQYMQSPLEKLQLQKYSQDIAKGGIDIAKAKKELSDLMKTTAAPGLTTAQREDLIKNPTAKQAQARIGVIKAVEDYGKKVSLYKQGLLTGAELRELNTALKTTVGSAINVAQGQGAMGEEEGKRILDNLEAGRLTREKKTLAAVKGVVEAQDSLLQTELQFIDSGIPGASDSFQLFADYKRSKTDPLLLSPTQSGKDSLGLGI